MNIVNYTDFRKNLAENLNKVTDDGDIVVVARSKGKNVVVMSMDEYNSISETMYLSSSETNRKRIVQAIDDANNGKYVQHDLIEG